MVGIRIPGRAGFCSSSPWSMAYTWANPELGGPVCSEGTSNIKDTRESLCRDGREGEERTTEDLGKFSPPGVGSVKALRACLSEREEKQKEEACLDFAGGNAHLEHLPKCPK